MEEENKKNEEALLGGGLFLVSNMNWLSACFTICQIDS